MANKRRGEIDFKVGDKTYTLCMTLGAMAELEDVFELDSITDLSKVFKADKFKVGDLIKLLGALLRGGGHDIEDGEIEAFDLDAVEAFSAAMDAINVQGETPASPKTRSKARAKKTAKKKR